jgi:hypothetical protein
MPRDSHSCLLNLALFPVRQFLYVRRNQPHCLTVDPFCKTIAGVYRQLWTCHGVMWLHRAKRGLSIFSLHGERVSLVGLRFGALLQSIFEQPRGDVRGDVLSSELAVLRLRVLVCQYIGALVN